MPSKNLAQPIQTHFESNMPRYLDLLKQMVQINSFTANAAGVNELGGLTAEAFAKLGFVAEYIQSAIPHYGKHLVLTRQGTGPHKIGLVSHLDTVFPPEEEELPPEEPEEGAPPAEEKEAPKKAPAKKKAAPKT